MRAKSILLAAGIAALVATGCGETVIDVDKASKLIQTAVEGQVGAKVKSVTCPKDVKVKAKSTFECTVTGIDGTKGVATVTQKDDKGNVAVAAPFLHTLEAEQSIATQLRKRTPNATVDCPEIIVVAKGGKFECKATGAGTTATVFATQKDTSGNFTFRVG